MIKGCYIDILKANQYNIITWIAKKRDIITIMKKMKKKWKINQIAWNSIHYTYILEPASIATKEVLLSPFRMSYM